MTLFGLSLAVWQWALAAVAAAVLFVVLFGTWVIRENQSGLVIKRFGQPLPSGRFIARDGEAGYQARMLPPGWHIGWWIWQYQIISARRHRPAR
jgi:uncharacterized membrane protein YqiK